MTPQDELKQAQDKLNELRREWNRITTEINFLSRQRTLIEGRIRVASADVSVAESALRNERVAV